MSPSGFWRLGVSQLHLINRINGVKDNGLIKVWFSKANFGEVCRRQWMIVKAWSKGVYSFSHICYNLCIFSVQSLLRKKRRKKNKTLSVTWPSEHWVHQQVATERGRRHLWIPPSGNSFINHTAQSMAAQETGCSVLPTNKQHNRFFPIPSLTRCIFDPSLSFCVSFLFISNCECPDVSDEIFKMIILTVLFIPEWKVVLHSM